MQSETSFATSFGEQASSLSDEQATRTVIQSVKDRPRISDHEKRLDVVSASVVVGGTAQFVTFLFGLVTEFIPRVFDNVLLSAFVGLCVAAIAYALMKGSE
ncbi:MAG TPA: hypothetical protein PLK30_10500 [Blastocatellia bacterium]|nr:hypothetical protein [Blastocatellia bacterium]